MDVGQVRVVEERLDTDQSVHGCEHRYRQHVLSGRLIGAGSDPTNLLRDACRRPAGDLILGTRRMKHRWSSRPIRIL